MKHPTPAVPIARITSLAHAAPAAATAGASSSMSTTSLVQSFGKFSLVYGTGQTPTPGCGSKWNHRDASFTASTSNAPRRSVNSRWIVSYFATRSIVDALTSSSSCGPGVALVPFGRAVSLSRQSRGVDVRVGAGSTEVGGGVDDAAATAACCIASFFLMGGVDAALTPEDAGPGVAGGWSGTSSTSLTFTGVSGSSSSTRFFVFVGFPSGVDD